MHGLPPECGLCVLHSRIEIKKRWQRLDYLNSTRVMIGLQTQPNGLVTLIIAMSCNKAMVGFFKSCMSFYGTN